MRQRERREWEKEQCQSAAYRRDAGTGVAKIAPPPKLTLSEWADNYRRLSQGTSAMPGKWRTSKAPYQKEIMDAISDNHVRKVVVMSAAQIGKTDALVLNTIGYYMKYAPAPIMVMQPSLEMGQGFSKERLTPMLHDTPCLRGMVDDRSRMSGNTILQKKFPGGLVVIVGANSPASLASRPIKVLLADEIDRYPGQRRERGRPVKPGGQAADILLGQEGGLHQHTHDQGTEPDRGGI